jgi:U3 small nucleolar RNA-associated protein 12
MAGERIIEALEISDEDRIQLDHFEDSNKSLSPEALAKLAPRKRNAIFSIYNNEMNTIDPEIHVLNVIKKISPASLNDALLVLPFALVVSMLKHIDYWTERVCLPIRMKSAKKNADYDGRN